MPLGDDAALGCGRAAVARAAPTDATHRGIQQRLVDNALELAQHCAKLYGAARANERRMFNQGLFTKIYIDDDGTVSDAELQEPFVHLLSNDMQTKVQHRERRANRSLRISTASTAPIPATDVTVRTTESVLSRGERFHQERQEHSLSAVLLSFAPQPTLSYALGLNNEHLAEATSWHSNPSSETNYLLERWPDLQT